jgi:plasmid stability protein
MSDSTHKGPDVSKVPHVGGARPSAPPPPRAEASKPAAAPRPATPAKPSEQQFRQSLDGLSRSLGARAAQHPDPVAEAAARRAIVQAQIRAEDRRLKLVLGIAGAAAAAVCLAAAIVFIAAPFGPRAAAPAVEAKAA